LTLGEKPGKKTAKPKRRSRVLRRIWSGKKTEPPRIQCTQGRSAEEAPDGGGRSGGGA